MRPEGKQGDPVDRHVSEHHWEEDCDEPRHRLPSISMRMRAIAFCLVYLALVFAGSTRIAPLLGSLGQVELLAENESQPPEQEEPQEPPQGQETTQQGIGSASRSGIFIEADGSVNPPTAPILRDGNVYTLYDMIYYETIWVERDNIVIDGAGLWVMGFYYDTIFLESYDIVVDLAGQQVMRPGSIPDSTGIVLAGMRNVTIKNLTITGFKHGISGLRDSCVITDCTIRGLQGIRENWEVGGSGIESYDPSNATIKNSIVTGFGAGISLWQPETCAIVNNTVSNNGHGDSGGGILLGEIPGDDGEDVWENNIVVGNMVTNNSVGIWIDNPNGFNQLVYHNTFIDNDIQVEHIGGSDISGAIWDDGPQSGGNYWSDYTGRDDDGDGIGDTPYIIGQNYDQDRYPLMKPWTGLTEPLLPILSLLLLSTIPSAGVLHQVRI